MARRDMSGDMLSRETRSGHMRPRERGAHHDNREKMGRDAPHERGDNEGRSDGGVKMVSDPWRTGSDASYIEPRLIPDYELLGRDDSGGPEWQPYTAEFGDGGYVTGDKAHLSARGGRDDELDGDEQRSTYNARNEGRGGERPGPASSTRRARE